MYFLYKPLMFTSKLKKVCETKVIYDKTLGKYRK